MNTLRETITIPASIFHNNTNTKDRSAEVALLALLTWLAEMAGQDFTETPVETFAKTIGWSKRKTVGVLKRLEQGKKVLIERRPPLPSRYRVVHLLVAKSQAQTLISVAPTVATNKTLQLNAGTQVTVEQRLDLVEKTLERIKIKVANIEPAIMEAIKLAFEMEIPNIKKHLQEITTQSQTTPPKPAAPPPAPTQPAPPAALQKPSKR